jgi:cytochrome bd-type quinol oxidase subunit 2
MAPWISSREWGHRPRPCRQGVCAVLYGWFARLTPFLAPVGAVFAFLAKYLGDIVALAKRDPGWQAWIKKILAMAALWFAAITVPSGLWLLYLQLTFIGLGSASAPWIYFGALIVTGLVAAVLNPNATSLFRLYRDRGAPPTHPKSRAGKKIGN